MDIGQLFHKGDYLGASELADKYRLETCQNVSKLLCGLHEIVETIDHSLVKTSSLEGRIDNYLSKIESAHV